MTSTLDTNIFLYGTISNKCSELIVSTYKNNKYNIVLWSVSDETRKKLMVLNTILTIFYDELKRNKNLLNQLQSSMYHRFEQNFPQIYGSFRTLLNSKNIRKEDVRRIILSILNNIRYFTQITHNRTYPTTKDDLVEIEKSKAFCSCIKKLNSVIKNEGDKYHMALCNQFIICNLKKERILEFYTLDKKDFLVETKKRKIESIIENLRIKTINLDLENINISF